MSVVSPPHEGYVAQRENQVGLPGAFAYAVGGIVGSGIFITPGSVLAQVNMSVGLCLCVWLLAGLIAVNGALCYSELGTSIPQSGSDFTFVSYVGWKPLAFSILIIYMVIAVAGSTAIILSVGEYASLFVQNLLADEQKLSDSGMEILKLVISYTSLVCFTILNLYSLGRHASKVQIVVTSAKMVTIMVIVVTGVVYLCKGATTSFDGAFSNITVTPQNVIDAFLSSYFSYSGWEYLLEGLEGIQDPHRNLPLACAGSVFIVIAVYLLMNVAFLSVLTPNQLVHGSEAVVTQFSTAALNWFAPAMPILVCVVILGTLNASIFAATRYVRVVAEKGCLPEFMQLVNTKHDAPRPAVLVWGILIGLSPILTQNIAWLINYTVFNSLVCYAGSISAIIFIRLKKIPVDEKAVKVPLILHFSFLAILLAMIGITLVNAIRTFGSGGYMVLIGAAIIPLGILCYYPFVSRNPLHKCDAYNRGKVRFNVYCARITGCDGPVAALQYEEISETE